MPTDRDYPWLRDKNAGRYRSDPEDLEAAAKLHLAKQLNVIDEARESTSVGPPRAALPPSRPVSSPGPQQPAPEPQQPDSDSSARAWS